MKSFPGYGFSPFLGGLHGTQGIPFLWFSRNFQLRSMGLVCCNTADSKPARFQDHAWPQTWSWSDASKSGFYGRNCAARYPVKTNWLIWPKKPCRLPVAGFLLPRVLKLSVQTIPVRRHTPQRYPHAIPAKGLFGQMWFWIHTPMVTCAWNVVFLRRLHNAASSCAQ